MTSNLNLDIGTLALNITNVDKNEILNMLYPVGSVYISMNITSPSELFGGEWTRITDCFLWCTHYSSKATGGSKKISTSNLPSHSHAIDIETSGNHSALYRWSSASNERHEGRISGDVLLDESEKVVTDDKYLVDHTHTISGNTKNTGSGADYMPPYMTVYAWYRTA